VLSLLAALTGCSLDRLATQTVAGLISGGGSDTVMAGDDDPQLVAEALPFTLKLHELLLAELPDDDALLLATGRGFVVYAASFIQRPAERLPDRQIELRISELARAKLHYLRAREYLLTGIELRHPGFRGLLAAGDVTAALTLVDTSSIDYLYWLGAAWLGATSTDPADLALVADVLRAGALLEQVAAWDPGYAGGAVHDVLIAYYGSLPDELGGGVQRARRHFELAVAASGGTRARPYVAMAAVTIRDQDTAQFRALLQQALAVPADVPEYRLQNALDREHAAWLLEHMEDFFLEL
jgi:predicted anti-sigma-YlaC factor YlaD